MIESRIIINESAKSINNIVAVYTFKKVIHLFKHNTNEEILSFIAHFQVFTVLYTKSSFWQ